MFRSPNLFIAATAALAVLLAGQEVLAQARMHDRDPGQQNAPADMLDVPATVLIPGDVAIEHGVKNPAAEDTDSAARGMKYFADFNCSGCHAANGGGGMGPSLSNGEFLFGDKPEQIYLSIAQGRPAGMPAWGAVLPSAVIWDLVSYIQSIGDAPSTQWGTTTSLDTFTVEQVPPLFKSTPDPWKYTQPLSFGQKPEEHQEDGEG